MFPSAQEQSGPVAARLHVSHLRHRTASSGPSPRLALFLQEKADPETARLHVGHLTRNVEASHVQEIFGSFGTLKVGPAPLGPGCAVLAVTGAVCA